MLDFGSRQFRSVGVLVGDVKGFDRLENFFDSSFEGIEFTAVNDFGRSKNELSRDNLLGSSFEGIEFTAVNGFDRFENFLDSSFVGIELDSANSFARPENFLDSSLGGRALLGAVNESGLSTNGLSGENFIGSFLGIAFEYLPPRPVSLLVAFPLPFSRGVGWNCLESKPLFLPPGWEALFSWARVR